MNKFIVIFCIITTTIFSLSSCQKTSQNSEKSTAKMYWFLPDGFRADPDVFNVFEWARNGELPNIKKMMDNGAYGFSKPVYPGHTPTNFATLFTGVSPKKHGIADGPMHVEGYPLKVVSTRGFSSTAKLVPPIWYTLEEQKMLSTLLSVPGSTPPELNKGVTIKGRWGGWGVDFPAVVFHTANDVQLRHRQGPGNKLFGMGSNLTQFIKSKKPKGWNISMPKSYSQMREIEMNNWNSTVFGLIYDTTNDRVENYDKVIFSMDKESILGVFSESEWSGWNPIKLTMKKMSFDTSFMIRVIKLGKKDFFRIRFIYSGLNRSLSKPSHWASKLNDNVGPMLDFVDNFPPQLIHYKEDKQAFIEEGMKSITWHKNAIGYMLDHAKTDVFIHDIYTPNQFLTGRWWMGYIDPTSPRYNDVSDQKRKQLWSEIKAMYKAIDGILGEAIKRMDKNSYIVLSSDHGAVPLYKEVRLNNLFAKNGLLKYKINQTTGHYTIDWKNTKAVFMKMIGVYVNPNGLAGNYKRASGPDYIKLRAKVIKMIKELKDDNGAHPLGEVRTWEQADYFGLPQSRVGDIIINNIPGYGWVESISADHKFFVTALKTGYKQAIQTNTKGMWTPFVIMGPGIKKNTFIDGHINHADQYPTIMKLLGKKSPNYVEGKVISEIFE